MPRFFSKQHWIAQIPVIFDSEKISTLLESQVKAEIFSLVDEQKMDISLCSRVARITVLWSQIVQIPYLTIRFNVLNCSTMQFAYKISDGGKLIRDKAWDQFGIHA